MIFNSGGGHEWKPVNHVKSYHHQKNGFHVRAGQEPRDTLDLNRINLISYWDIFTELPLDGFI